MIEYARLKFERFYMECLSNKLTSSSFLSSSILSLISSTSLSQLVLKINIVYEIQVNTVPVWTPIQIPISLYSK